MIGPLESGIGLNSPNISCELEQPCFEASALYMEVSGNIPCQLRLEYSASGPLVQQDSPAKPVLDVTQSLDVVFSSDRSVYEFPADRDSSEVVRSCTIGYDWNDRFVASCDSTDRFTGKLRSRILS